MAGPSTNAFELRRLSANTKHHVLIVDAPYYADVSAALLTGALEQLEAFGATHERVTVPGALEIPQVLAAAAHDRLIPISAQKGRYSGMIALGCVIRGETSHYDIVCNNANHWMMETAIKHGIPVGNAILTVDTHAQAMKRASGGINGKGGDAARACLHLAEVATMFDQKRPV